MSDQIVFFLAKYKGSGWHRIVLISPWGNGIKVRGREGEWESPESKKLAMALLNRVLHGNLGLLDLPVLYEVGINKLVLTWKETKYVIYQKVSLEGKIPFVEKLIDILCGGGGHP